MGDGGESTEGKVDEAGQKEVGGAVAVEEEDSSAKADDGTDAGSDEAGSADAAGIDEAGSADPNDPEDEKTFPSNSSNSDETVSDSAEEPGQSSGLPPSSSRLMRNLAEKMRRDKLNMYISELSSLVPIVAMATKRMDKTSVLRLSANFLRIHLSLKQDRKTSVRPPKAPGGLESSLSSTLLEALEGFMLIVTSSGKIVYVSESVEKLLGHSQLDLMGQSLYTICHSGDTELLRHHLQPPVDFDPTAALEAAEDAGSSTADNVPRSPSFFGGRPEDSFSGLAAGERRSFYVRLTERSLARGDPVRHVTVHLNGLLRPPTSKKDGPKTAKDLATTGSGDEHLLVCVARPFRNKGITELSLMEAVQDEYVTRHLPDGRIIYSDHRIAFVAGYLTEEVMGMSAFNFIHQEDIPWATVANRQMFSSIEGQGYSVYRLRSKTGCLIHLRTRGFLEFNKTTQKVETFVCINTLLTDEEGDKELEKERERITPFLTFQQVTTTSTSTKAISGVSSIEEVSATADESTVQTLPALESERSGQADTTKSQQSSPVTVMSTVIHASMDVAMVAGKGRKRSPSHTVSSCSIQEISGEDENEFRPPVSPVETKVRLRELSGGGGAYSSPTNQCSPSGRVAYSPTNQQCSPSSRVVHSPTNQCSPSSRIPYSPTNQGEPMTRMPYSPTNQRSPTGRMPYSPTNQRSPMPYSPTNQCSPNTRAAYATMSQYSPNGGGAYSPANQIYSNGGGIHSPTNQMSSHGGMYSPTNQMSSNGGMYSPTPQLSSNGGMYSPTPQLSPNGGLYSPRTQNGAGPYSPTNQRSPCGDTHSPLMHPISINCRPYSPTNQISPKDEPYSPLHHLPKDEPFSPTNHHSPSCGLYSPGGGAYTLTNYGNSLELDPISSPSATCPTMPHLSPHSPLRHRDPPDSLPLLVPVSMDQIQTLIYVTHSPAAALPGEVGGRSPSPDSMRPLEARSRADGDGGPFNGPSAKAFPRLKRSLAEVEDLVTSSAKRSIHPSTFLNYNSSALHHHSAHLGGKWGTETTTTIIYDQHNNNG